MVHIAVLLALALAGMAAAFPNPFYSGVYTDTVRFLLYVYSFTHIADCQ